MKQNELKIWRIKLTVLSGESRSQTVILNGDSAMIGKTDDCSLVLTDATVSRRHMRIRHDPEGWRVVDLDSTNGSFVNGARVRSSFIPPGALLRAGTVEIAFTPERDEAEVNAWPEAEYHGLYGQSLVMRQLFGLMDRVAGTDATVLIEGDTGVGKSHIAKVLYEASTRAEGPYVVVDCGSVQSELIASELFGHERGAFSGAFQQRKGAFELANQGTLFLDDLGEISLDLQPNLLRALDARNVKRVGGDKMIPVDLRVIAASQRSLAREVERGVFREDLYFRLSVVKLRVPPLRERPEDIAPLAERFLTDFAANRGLGELRLGGKALDRLTSHDWPGNVRELRNTIERAVLMASFQPGSSLKLGPLFGTVKAKSPRAPPPELRFDPSLSFKEAKARWMSESQERYLGWLMDRADGNISQAARDANMDRKYLHKLLDNMGWKR